MIVLHDSFRFEAGDIIEIYHFIESTININRNFEKMCFEAKKRIDILHLCASTSINTVQLRADYTELR